MSMLTLFGSGSRRISLALVLATLLMSASTWAQDGTQNQPPQPPPKQEPPKSGGQSSSGGGVGVEVNPVDVGKEIVGLFRHVKIHLTASQQQAQAGDPILFTTTVSPNARGLVYEFRWTNDKNARGELEAVPNINHAYSSAGEYKVSVVVYQQGKKIGTSNEVKITVQPAPVAVVKPTPPPPDKVPPPTTPPVIIPPATTPATQTTTATNNPPSTLPTNPVTNQQQPSTPKKPPRPPAPVQPPLVTPPNPATGAGNTVEVNPVVVSPPIPTVYTLTLAFDPKTEAGKPTDFQASLRPEPREGSRVHFCFGWGDGTPETCQDSPKAVHTYRSKGKYLAAVEAFAGTEQLASRRDRLAASEPVQIDALAPLWLRLLPLGVGLLAVIVATSYATHKVRKLTRGTVNMVPDFGRHALSSETPHSGDVLRIRCVRAPARSSIRFR